MHPGEYIINPYLQIHDEDSVIDSHENTEDSNNVPGQQIQIITGRIQSGRPHKLEKQKFESAKNLSTDPLAQELILILCKLGKLSFQLSSKDQDNKALYGPKSILKQVRKIISEQKPAELEDYMFISQTEPKFVIQNGIFQMVENQQQTSFNALLDSQFSELPYYRLKQLFKNCKHVLHHECYSSLQSITITYLDYLQQGQPIDNIKANILEQIEKDEYLQKWAKRRNEINHILVLIEQKDITLHLHEIRRQKTKAALKTKKLLDKQQECLQQQSMLPLLEFFVNKMIDIINKAIEQEQKTILHIDYQLLEQLIDQPILTDELL